MRHIVFVEPALYIPNNIVIEQVYVITRTLHKNGFARLYPIEEQILRDTIILVAAVHPKCITTDGLGENIASVEAIGAIMDLNASCLPRELHFLPSSALNQVVLNQQVNRIHTRNATDTSVINLISTNNRISVLASGLMRTVPTLTATVDTNGMDVDTVARTVVQALGVPLRSGK